MDNSIAIQLKELGYNLSVEFNYAPGNTANVGFGVGRSCTANDYVVSTIDGSGGVTVHKGDQSQYGYVLAGTSGGITNYTSSPTAYNPNTIIYDGTNFRETAINGAQTVYSAHTSVSPPKFEITEVISPQMVIATYLYGTGSQLGLLQNIEFSDGRALTLTYAPGPVISLLSTVEDPGARLYSFSYDTNANLTQYTAPSGCATQYTVYPSGANAGLVFSIEDSRGFINQYGYRRNHAVVLKQCWTLQPYLLSGNGGQLRLRLEQRAGSGDSSQRHCDEHSLQCRRSAFGFS
jgi:hypothetical protein